jgi:hypothetical protein
LEKEILEARVQAEETGKSSFQILEQQRYMQKQFSTNQEVNEYSWNLFS